MNVLLLGSGGREHALHHALISSGYFDKVIWAPGNAGVHRSVRRAIDIKDFAAIVACAIAEDCSTICVGPEQPLCDGLVDYVAQHAPGISVFGPSKVAAEFEADKHLTKMVAKLNGIRTADYQVALTLDRAAAAIKDWGFPIVLKYPYLAAGKGVKVAHDHTVADAYAADVLVNRVFAHKKLLIEKFIAGRELSVFAVCNGTEAVYMGEACDYKLATAEPGENRMTGGMGAYSPVPWVSDELRARIKAEILDPMVRAMAKDGRPYRGILYLGLMIDPEGAPWLIEINCRGGDPEMQVVLPRLADGVFAQLMFWSLGLCPKPAINDTGLVAVYTVLCAVGYPDPYEKGYPIGGIAEAKKYALVLHAGTEESAGQIVGVGGRVLGTLGLGEKIEQERSNSQRAASIIARASDGKLRYRDDIAAGI